MPARRPTIIELTTRQEIESARARWWRKNMMHLTRKELAFRLGMNVHRVGDYERGYDEGGRPISARAWMRYRLMCAGLTVPGFNWNGGCDGKGQGSQGDERIQERRLALGVGIEG